MHTTAGGQALVSVASFDPTLQVVWFATLITTILTGLLLMRVVWLRLANLWAEQKRNDLARIWRPVFAESLMGATPALPPLGPRELFPFLALWNHYYLSVKGEARQSMVHLAERSGLPARLPALLHAYGKHRKLEAVHLLGRMRASYGWDELLRIAHGKDPILSLAALRALLEIDPAPALDAMLAEMLDRRDWSEILIANILIETGLEDTAAALVQRLLDASSAQQARLLYWLEVTRARAALPHVRQLLSAPANDEITLRCLRIATRLADRECLGLARNFGRAQATAIRQRVAAYLARCGTDADIPLLLEMTGDSRWPVRHEAARALFALPFLDRNLLLRAQQDHNDRFARDMLSQVSAEKRWENGV